MNLTIYTIAYNEEIMLPFMIDWYRKRFPECKIVVYDNYSTDDTVAIALKNNCEVILYDTNDQLSDSKYLEIKNNCWKTAITDWVLICDVDELLDINEQQLIFEKEKNTTIIKAEGWNMLNLNNNLDLETITHGFRSPSYDKKFLFRKDYITEINYEPGCHEAYPIGNKKYTDTIYKCFHFKFINEDYIVNRYKLFANRMSSLNKKNGWGVQYLQKEKEIREHFEQMKKWEHVIKLL